MYRIFAPAARIAAVAAIFGPLAVAVPARAAPSDLARSTAPASALVMAQATSPQTSPAPSQMQSKPGRTPRSPLAMVDARIKDLHGKLKITSEQETQWAVVAQAMRDNAKAMDDLIKARAQNAKTMSAVDDLRSYEQLAEVHADGIKKFIDAFQPLYDGMSDSQKKTADVVFRSHERRMRPHK